MAIYTEDNDGSTLAEIETFVRTATDASDEDTRIDFDQLKQLIEQQAEWFAEELDDEDLAHDFYETFFDRVVAQEGKLDTANTFSIKSVVDALEGYLADVDYRWVL